VTQGAIAVRVGWICLLVVGVGIFGFGVGTALFSGDVLSREDGVALTGMGLFGTLVTLVPFRRRERWAWVALWFYPFFWCAHLVGQLPPGRDHVHQIVFIALSLVGLIVPTRTFWKTDRIDDHKPNTPVR
jgi:hypothetical protein